MLMLKARATLKISLNHLRYVVMNMDIRKQWETILFDFGIMDQTKDMNYCKSYYAYKSPPMASDRDFLMEMQLWHDFPEKNMMCCHMKSIKDERMPDRKGRVRADCHIMSVIGKPDKDA